MNFSGISSEYTPLDIMAIIVVVANCPFANLPQNLK
jgi:hypothetical protein